MNESDSLPKFPNGTRLSKMDIGGNKAVYGTPEVLSWLAEQLKEKEAKPFTPKPVAWR